MPMTPEERERYDRIDRQLEFLAAHQAQLTSNIASHDAQIAENSRQIAQHSQQIAEHSRQIGQLVGVMASMAHIVEDTDEHFKALAESQRRTDQRLSAFINAVERYMSGGRN